MRINVRFLEAQGFYAKFTDSNGQGFLASFKDYDTINVTFTEAFELAQGQVNLEYYTGSYDVVPMAFDEQILYTRQKAMSRNVKVHEIPYSEVSNVKGGLTATIGG